MKTVLACLMGLCAWFILSGCGPAAEQVEQTKVVQMAQAISGTISAVPTVTANPTLTPWPTYTRQPTLTPQPSLTPVFTPTPQPTYTWQPTLTPWPTATATPTPTSTPTRPPVTALPPTPTTSLAETLLLEVNRRIFYYESYNGTFYARCDYSGCNRILACDQVVYYYDLLVSPYTLNVAQGSPEVQAAYQKLQTAIAQATTGYGWANTCRTALANGATVTTQDSNQGAPFMPGDVMSLLREAKTILESLS